MVALSPKIDELKLEDFDGEITQTIRLFNISWKTYKSILSDMGDHRSTRIAYEKGTLTIKMPSKLHEIVNRLLARIVTTLTEELDLEVVSIGSTTLERSELRKGAEPDTGLYIQNADRLRGLNPSIPPNLPPDLVIEVDITSPSTQRMGIYQALGIPEVWRYTKRDGVIVYHLQIKDRADAQTGGYSPATNSRAIPQLSAKQLNQFLNQRQTQSENQTIRDVRKWIQSLEQSSN